VEDTFAGIISEIPVLRSEGKPLLVSSYRYCTCTQEWRILLLLSSQIPLHMSGGYTAGIISQMPEFRSGEISLLVSSP
jgi:hypothetical protein